MIVEKNGGRKRIVVARALAGLALVSELEDESFRVWRQTRTGLLNYPLDRDYARAHLAASVYLQMGLRPHIVHVVGYSEVDHAARAAGCAAAQEQPVWARGNRHANRRTRGLRGC